MNARNRPLELPEAICELAGRLGASTKKGTSSVVLTQSGKMRDPPVGRWMAFEARQSIAIDRPGFSWKARTGPLGCITVVDALANGDGDISVKLFDWLPIARVRRNEAVNRGELLRYLAELPWVPDAILRNGNLSWSIDSDACFKVMVGLVSLEIQLDVDGRIGSVGADRPRKEGADFVTRPWRGQFFDYRKINDRWIPHGAEVGWVLDGELRMAWRGTLQSWSVI